MIEYIFLSLPFLLTATEICVLVFGSIWHFDGKSNFMLKVILFALGTFAFSLLISALCFFDVWHAKTLEIIHYALTCGLAILAGIVCFRKSAWSIIFCGGVALSARFVALQFARTINLILIANNVMDYGWCEYIARIICMVVMFICTRLLFVKKYQSNLEQFTGGFSSCLCPVFIAVSVVLEFAFVYVYEFGAVYQIILSVCGVFYGLFMLFIEYAFLYQGQSEVELSVVKSLWNEDRKHYNMQKENVDIINIKCHDLRHQIQNIRTSGSLNEKAIEEIENSIYIYDAIIETNNEVLNVILSDYSLRCQKYGVLLTCMADGEKIAFMEELDVYSLFGNMLENALEYEQTVQPCENRFISLTVKEHMGILSIHAENYYAGNATIRDGVVETTKKDKAYHGYGMKSMKKIVEKYDGKFDVLIADDMFQVEIIIPVPKQKQIDKGGKE